MQQEVDEAKLESQKGRQQSEDKLTTVEAMLVAERAKLEETEARFNMEQVSVNESLSLTKADLTATQEKLMDVVKHNDELRGLNIG